jgi:hypothetical protein
VLPLPQWGYNTYAREFLAMSLARQIYGKLNLTIPREGYFVAPLPFTRINKNLTPFVHLASYLSIPVQSEQKIGKI